MKTAEWQCTVCGTTNRKLVADTVTADTDRCVTCHTAHVIEMDTRPVRWKASPLSRLPTGRGQHLGRTGSSGGT